MAKDVIIALDFENKEKTLAFLDQFTGRKPFVKIALPAHEDRNRARFPRTRWRRRYMAFVLHLVAGTFPLAWLFRSVRGFS